MSAVEGTYDIIAMARKSLVDAEEQLCQLAFVLTDPDRRSRITWVEQDGIVGRCLACNLEPLAAAARG